jgi:CheY-like chemotaxis protein
MGEVRKPRALIFDDNESILGILEKLLSKRGYEVLSFAVPTSCPIYGNDAESCSNLYPCADLIVTDFHRSRMNGIELLERQRRKGCLLNPANMALISGYLNHENKGRINELGCAFFQKPFSLTNLLPWLTECEGRMDLSRPVGIKRSEPRRVVKEKIACHVGVDDAILEGAVLNTSDSGLCLEIGNPLPSDQRVTVSTGLPDGCQTAAVRWVKKTDDDAFLVGLNCR